jgi:hypothetical protein
MDAGIGSVQLDTTKRLFNILKFVGIDHRFAPIAPHPYLPLLDGGRGTVSQCSSFLH